MSHTIKTTLTSSLGFGRFWWYAGLYCLVIVYANAYFIWIFLSSKLVNVAHYIPLVFTGAVLLVGFFLWSITRVKQELKGRWLIVGLLFVLVALLIPDNQAPAKRIHVAEYLFLAFFVFRLQRRQVTGWWLIVSSVLITILYGAHDEMIQGLLKSRSFGHKDIIVDGVSGVSGVCIAYALWSDSAKGMTGGGSQGVPSNILNTGQWLFSIAVLFVIQVLMIVIKYDTHVVAWVMLYASVVYILLGVSVYRFSFLWQTNREGMLVISCLSVSLLVYLSSTVLFPSLLFK